MRARRSVVRLDLGHMEPRSPVTARREDQQDDDEDDEQGCRAGKDAMSAHEFFPEQPTYLPHMLFPHMRERSRSRGAGQ